MSMSVFLLIDPVDKMKPPAFTSKLKAEDVRDELNQGLRDNKGLRGNYWRVKECLLVE